MWRMPPLGSHRGLRLALAFAFAGLVWTAATFAVDRPREKPPNEPANDGLAALVALLAELPDDGVRLDVLRGLQDALRGRGKTAAPTGWEASYAALRAADSKEVRAAAESLAVQFGDGPAAARAEARLLDAALSADVRRLALADLVNVRHSGLARNLLALLDDGELRGDAIRALAAIDAPSVPAALLSRYDGLTPPEQLDAVTTLASRAAWAGELLQAVEGGAIPARDLSAFTARQIEAFGDELLRRKLEQVWGAVRPTSEAKQQALAKYAALLAPEGLSSADAARGRQVFERTCAQCHRMYGQGGQVGPDLTGSNRKNLDYLLSNVLDPSAVIPKDYELTLAVLADGRLLSGVVIERAEATLTFITPSERVTVRRDEIEQMETSKLSMMPEGLLDRLSGAEVRDLAAYLKSETQVDLP